MNTNAMAATGGSEQGPEPSADEPTSADQRYSDLFWKLHGALDGAPEAQQLVDDLDSSVGERISAMETDVAEIAREIRNDFPALRAENDALRANLRALAATVIASTAALSLAATKAERGSLSETVAEPDRWSPLRRAMTGDWVDDMRQRVEQRLGVPAGDESVLDDPAYVAVLDADRALEEARDRVAAAIAGVEADQ